MFDKCLLCSVGSIWVCLGLSGSRSRSSLGSLSPEAERGRKEGRGGDRNPCKGRSGSGRHHVLVLGSE